MSETDDNELTTAGSLRAVALERGWTYREQDTGFADRWCGAPFTTWRPHRALDVITGAHEGVPIAAFRFVVSEKTGRVGYLVVAAALPGPLPRVSLVPLTDPVDTDPYGELYEPEDPLLTEQYQIAAVDVDATGALLHLAGVDQLRHYAPTDWRIEDSDLLGIRLDEVEFDAEEVSGAIDAAAALAGGIPSDVFAKYEPAPGYPQPIAPGLLDTSTPTDRYGFVSSSAAE